MCKVVLPTGYNCSVPESILGLCTSHWKIYRDNMKNPLPLKYEGCFKGFARCGICNLEYDDIFHCILISLNKSQVGVFVCVKCYKQYPAFKQCRWVDNT